MSRSTYTYAVLEVSPQVYNEIAGKLRQAGYHGSFDKDDGSEIIDMHGIALKALPVYVTGTIGSGPRNAHSGTPCDKCRDLMSSDDLPAGAEERASFCECGRIILYPYRKKQPQSANDREPQPVTERPGERQPKEIIVEWPQ